MTQVNFKLSDTADEQLTRVISFLMEIGILKHHSKMQVKYEAIIDCLFKIQETPEIRKQVTELINQK
jgi:NAD(P)H-hydrate repair Nnr-like enzyme with NAD(P)H-hydrate epimerase domain